MGTDQRYRVGIALHDFALGGTERVAVRLANAWVREGVDVNLFCGQVTGPLADMVDSAVRISAMSPPVPRGRGSCRELGRAIARALIAQPVDMLFIPGNYHWPVVPPVAAMRSGRPRIVVQISAALYKPQRSALRQFLFNRRMAHLLRKADYLIAMSEAAAEQARSIVAGPQVMMIDLPVLDDDMPPPVAVSTGAPVIMGIGRLVPEKGFAELIEAFAWTRTPDAQLVIVGSGPQEHALKALARDRGMADRVSFPGYVADSRPWLDKASLFVLSSWFEGFGAVVIEAMAAGRPVIATDCTPATALFEALPGAGMTVPLRDIHAMAEAIDGMLGKTPPPPENIARIVDRYHIGPVSRRYLHPGSGT